MFSSSTAVFALAGLCAAAATVGAAKIDSPAEVKIAAAREQIELQPEQAQPYNDLALALTQRARETADPSFYNQAEEILDKSLALEPGNLEGEKVRVWALLGRHEFQQARAAALVLHGRARYDPMVLALLADAHVEMGDYPAAVAAAQQLLDQRPGSVPALTRAAYLREIHGDIAGAAELMEQAYGRLPTQEAEDRAWVLSHIAHLRLTMGRVAEAEGLLIRALTLFPDYHYALGYLAETKVQRGQAEEALALRRRHFAAAPHPENRYYLAQALERAGKDDEAKRELKHFEKEALAEARSNDNANRELIDYYLADPAQPAKALRLAEAEIRRRQDLWTRMSYAWALYANGESGEADEHARQVLAIGVRDPQIFYRAAVIASGVGDDYRARSLLQKTVALNPTSESASLAKEKLEGGVRQPIPPQIHPTRTKSKE